MSAGAQIDWRNDPGFQQLPLAEKHKALLAIDSDYKALPPGEQVKALTAVHGATQFERDRPGTGINLEGSGAAALSTLKSMIPQDPTGGHSPLEKEFWLGDKSPSFEPSKGGFAEAWSEAKAGWERGGSDVRSKIGEGVTSGLGSLLGVSGKAAAAHAARGEGGAIIGEASVPAAMTALAPIAGEIPGKAGALASKVREGVTPAIQKAIGVGPEFTEAAVKDWQGKSSQVSEANRTALVKARGEHEATVADIEEQNRIKRQEAAQNFQDKWTSTEQQNKQALLKSQQGEVDFQSKVEAAKQANESARQTAVDKQQLQTEAMGHAKEVSDHLGELKEHEKAFGKSMYPEIEGTADTREIQGRLQNAIDTNIRGTDKAPTALARIVKELEPENPLAQASVFRGSGSAARSTGGKVSITELPQAMQDRIMRTMEERPGYEPPDVLDRKSLTFEQMHGYYSELGEELGKDLSGDERAAVTAARSELIGEMRKMAEDQGKLSQFTAAQKNWSKYENTFNKTWSDRRGAASPIAKALNLKDPVSGEMLPERVAKLLGKDDNYKLTQKMLGRYDAAKPEILQLMKEKMDQAGGMPKGIKETPIPERSFAPVSLKTPPEMPVVPQKALPESQSISLKPMPPTIDIQGLKADAIKKKMDMLGGFSGRGMFIDAASLVHFLTTGNPVALSIPIGRRLLAKAIRSSGALVGVTAEEAAMLKSVDQSAAPKNIKPSQVHPTKAAAMGAFKGGINVKGAEESMRPMSGEQSIDSLSNQIDTLKTKLRGAKDAPMAEKKALQKQIDDYQTRLDELRGQ
jgi:hypothetical protein